MEDKYDKIMRGTIIYRSYRSTRNIYINIKLENIAISHMEKKKKKKEEE